MNVAISSADINLTCKYGSFGAVLEAASDPLRMLLETCPIQVVGKPRTVDVKLQSLDVGNYTCIPGWHSDTRNDPNAFHHLWVMGINRTEFLEEDGSVSMIPNMTWKSYGHDLHRGPRVLVPEERILVRITESDRVKGNTKFKWRY